MKAYYQLDEALVALTESVTLTDDVRSQMEASVAFLHRYLQEATAPVYGVNTGFGSLQNVVISESRLSDLQENLLITHASGVGELLPRSRVKAMLWLKLLNMSKGYSAVRPILFERLATMYNDGAFPLVFEQGSLGASGDLAPLSQMVLPLIGKGLLELPGGPVLSGEQWLESKGWKPLSLGPKEALALINGTQFMLSHALEAYDLIAKIQRLLPWISALSLDAFDCRVEPFLPPIHRVRNQLGQQEVAAEILSILLQSPNAQQSKKQVQDQYSFRCIPQVHGASYDALRHCFEIWERELNAVTDNPNVFENENMVLSGGNFHGQPLALTLDYAAIALSELGSISERRIFLLVSGQRDLPPYLADDAGIDSGYMIAQYTAAALASQNKQLCTPASVDSIVSSNGQEDHVSMGANAAIKLMKVIANVEQILAIEWLCATRAATCRNLITSPDLQEELHSFVENTDLDHTK
ncbi:MAG: histidine ammonia-lyase, partial [Bacteroidota bacterium]